MQTGRLMCGTLSAWGMAIAYDWINRVIGYDVKVLMYASVVTLIVGLYVGLCTNNNETEKEEA